MYRTWIFRFAEIRIRYIPNNELTWQREKEKAKQRDKAMVNYVVALDDGQEE